MSSERFKTMVDSFSAGSDNQYCEDESLLESIKAFNNLTIPDNVLPLFFSDLFEIASDQSKRDYVREEFQKRLDLFTKDISGPDSFKREPRIRTNIVDGATFLISTFGPKDSSHFPENVLLKVFANPNIYDFRSLPIGKHKHIQMIIIKSPQTANA